MNIVSLSPVRAIYTYCLSEEPSSVKLLILFNMEKNLSFSPENGSHLTSCLPHCSIQFHCYFMSGMLLLHLYPLKVPSEITMILSMCGSNISLLRFNLLFMPSPLKERPHTYRVYNFLQELVPTPSQTLSVSFTSLWLEPAKQGPILVFFQIPLCSFPFLYLWSCNPLLGTKPQRETSLCLIIQYTPPPRLFPFKSYDN